MKEVEVEALLPALSEAEAEKLFVPRAKEWAGPGIDSVGRVEGTAAQGDAVAAVTAEDRGRNPRGERVDEHLVGARVVARRVVAVDRDAGQRLERTQDAIRVGWIDGVQGDGSRHAGERSRAGGPHHTSRPAARVLYMSGYELEQDRRGALLPEELFLAKPFTPEILVDKGREVLDRPRGQ